MRNFSAVPIRQYIGTPNPRAISIGGIAAQAVPLEFNWLAYGASTTNTNIAVNIDLTNQLVAKRLPRILSVYVDNLGSVTPIYILFPDTQYVIAVQPNSSGWFTVYTGENKLRVIGLGFVTGNIPTTFVLVTNFQTESAIDIEFPQARQLWLGSSTIQRGTTIYNTDFATPAVGDQTVQYPLQILGVGVIQNNLWGTPYASGFLYLTHIDLTVYNNSAGALSGVDFVIESTGAAGLLYTIQSRLVGGGNANALNFSSMNIKLDATQMYRVRCTGFTGVNYLVSAAFNFTTNPN